MIYEEYYRKYLSLKKVKEKINRLESKKITLMSSSEIKSSDPSKDTIKTNTIGDVIGNCVAELELIEQNLQRENNLKKEILGQLSKKEEELRESKEILDKIYLYKFIDRMKYHQICKKINYEKSSFYNFLDEVEKKLKEIRRLEKNGKY